MILGMIIIFGVSFGILHCLVIGASRYDDMMGYDNDTGKKE